MDVSILNRDWLLIGRQVRTAYGRLIDLLAIDANGSVLIIELKCDKTPRDVVAPSIDKAADLPPHVGRTAGFRACLFLGLLLSCKPEIR